MSIVEEEVQATVAKPQATLAKVDDGEFPEVQKLALTGYDFDNVLHLVLRIRSTDKARQAQSAQPSDPAFNATHALTIPLEIPPDAETSPRQVHA